jgi:broad specificity phosphatase PhoE
MTKIYLIRHGQTEWNKGQIFRGRIDISLNERGSKEAEVILGVMKDNNISAIYTSPLKRSIETARPMAEFFNLEIVPIDGLIDINYGDWQGLTMDDVRKRYKAQYNQWIKTPNLVRFPNGETLDEVQERSFYAFKEIVKKNPGKTIIVLPHRVINKVLLCALLGLGNSHFWDIKQDTGCINLIEYSGGRFVISLINDTCHLKEVTGDTVQPDF